MFVNIDIIFRDVLILLSAFVIRPDTDFKHFAIFSNVIDPLTYCILC